MRAAFRMIFLAAGLGWIAPAVAQAPSPRTQEEIDADLLAQIRDQPLERFIAKLLEPIRNAPTPGRLTREDVEAAAASARASERAAHVVEFLRSDLNGDGVLTIQEAEQADGIRRLRGPTSEWHEQRPARKSRGAELVLGADRNGDGRLDLAEMFASADRRTLESNDRPRQQGQASLLELDADGDGAVTIKEAETRARQLFARYDADGDGLIDPERRPEIRKRESARKSQTRLQRDAERCGVSPAPSEARIVLFLAGRTQAMASASVAGPMEATQTALVSIEPGEGKLYLVLAAHSNIIWRIEGAVDRLTNVVLLESRNDPLVSSAAVTGVDRSKLSWGEQETCATLLGHTAIQQTGVKFTALHGRPPDIFERVDVVSSIGIPSMRLVGEEKEWAVPVQRTPCHTALLRGMTFAPDTPAVADAEPCDWIRAEMELEFPGGVVALDPATIVGRQPAVPYQVLPSPFGFHKALQDGVMKDLSTAAGNRYRIEKPLPYFPPVVHHRRKIDFELADGIKVPQGAEQRYCVYDGAGKQVPTDSTISLCP